MLNQVTLELLQKACDKSNSIYEYGGLSFHYCLSTSYMMTLKNRSRISKLRAEKNTDFYPDEVELIQEFFELAMCSDGTSKLSEETKQFVSSLLKCLYSDFKEMPRCIIEPINTPLSSELVLLILAQEYYHELRLSWSPS